MAEIHVVSGGTVLADWSASRVWQDGAVAWQDGRVLQVGSRAELDRAFPDAQRHHAHGGWIAPGLVNAHHHLYSSLAAGLDPGMPIHGFGQRLDRLWWRLDRAHDEESIRHSVRLAALRCVMSGCTTLVDHHASPARVEGVLDVVAEELDQAGLKGVLCFESSDRNGDDEALRGLKESVRFRDANERNPHFRGLIGLHAAFTLRDETLVRAREWVEEGDIHIHVSEDALDETECRSRDGLSPVRRLEAHGLLGPRSFIAHAVHVDARDVELLARRGALLLHNPESNANNQVGRLDLRSARSLGVAVALGTDGMGPCMLGALRSAFLLHRAQLGEDDAGWRECGGLLDGARPHLARLFGEPRLGSLAENAPADLVVLDAQGLSDVSKDSLLGQLVFGATPLRVRHTVSRGRFLMENFRPCLQDAERIARESLGVRHDLWSRFRAMEAGTPYLGPRQKGQQEDS